MDKEKIIMEIAKRKDLIADKRIVAVYLFGSVADGRIDAFSDVDICVIGGGFSWDEKLRIMGSFPDSYDVSFFEDLPIWIKMRVLRGVSVIVNNKERVYDICFESLHEYEDFRILLNERIKRRFGKCMM